ncbi:MAG: flagellar hook protein FlgE [Burkholderiales bacterium]
MNFQQGLSGLNSTSKSLEVIGNNIANAGTYGAKASRTEFSDMYAATMSSGGTSSTGIGTRVAAVAQQFTQGTITTTENPLDVAINGAGFFQLQDTSGALLYSRNGQFKLDRDGFLTNNQGQKLLGYPADSQGNIVQGTASPLQLPTGGIEPKTTDAITMKMNLDSRVIAPAGATPINFSDSTTYSNATSMTVYDVKGQEVPLTYYFRKTATDNWDVYVTAGGSSISVDGAGNPAPVTSMVFPTNGAAPTAPVGAVTLNIPAAANASYEAVPGIALNFTNATQYGTSFNVADLSQNGYAPGQLTSVKVESNGVLTANYTNGKTKSAGQMELATFRNPQGLQAQGGNAWAQTYGSGDPIVGTPTSGTMGTLNAGALEESNVDLTGELVNMITAQRIYQANAQTIKTQDSVLQTLVSMR